MMTGKRQAYISQQLAALRDAGLVIAKRQGWNVFYQLNDIRLAELEKMVSDLFSSERPARPKLPRG
jgi:DNA-binding transcriptional ArsR family regulator